MRWWGWCGRWMTLRVRLAGILSCDTLLAGGGAVWFGHKAIATAIAIMLSEARSRLRRMRKAHK